MISNYKSNEVKPLIIDLMKKEGDTITSDNIKIWESDAMLAKDVVGGCNYIKSNGLISVLVYTNKVPMKDYISKSEGVKIYDAEDLAVLAIRHNSDLIKYL
jgi:hypothetical protein